MPTLPALPMHTRHVKHDRRRLPIVGSERRSGGRIVGGGRPRNVKEGAVGALGARALGKVRARLGV